MTFLYFGFIVEIMRNHKLLSLDKMMEVFIMFNIYTQKLIKISTVLIFFFFNHKCLGSSEELIISDKDPPQDEVLVELLDVEEWEDLSTDPDVVDVVAKVMQAKSWIVGLIASNITYFRMNSDHLKEIFELLEDPNLNSDEFCIAFHRRMNDFFEKRMGTFTLFNDGIPSTSKDTETGFLTSLETTKYNTIKELTTELLKNEKNSWKAIVWFQATLAGEIPVYERIFSDAQKPSSAYWSRLSSLEEIRKEVIEKFLKSIKEKKISHASAFPLINSPRLEFVKEKTILLKKVTLPTTYFGGGWNWSSFILGKKEEIKVN